MCDLCDGVEPWDITDPSLHDRIDAHENKHNRKGDKCLNSERDGHITNNSTNQGKVTWITLE